MAMRRRDPVAATARLLLGIKVESREDSPGRAGRTARDFWAACVHLQHVLKISGRRSSKTPQIHPLTERYEQGATYRAFRAECNLSESPASHADKENAWRRYRTNASQAQHFPLIPPDQPRKPARIPCGALSDVFATRSPAVALVARVEQNDLLQVRDQYSPKE